MSSCCVWLIVYAQFVSAHIHQHYKSLIILPWYWVNTWCLLAGAVRLQTPLLLPRNRKLYDGSEPACFMDHSGMLVTLPYDLRVSNPLYTHTYRTNTQACMSDLAHQTLIIYNYLHPHMQSAAAAVALRSCYLRKPRGLNGCFHTVIDYSLVCADFTVIILVHSTCQLSFCFRWLLQDSSLAIISHIWRGKVRMLIFLTLMLAGS